MGCCQQVTKPFKTRTEFLQKGIVCVCMVQDGCCAIGDGTCCSLHGVTKGPMHQHLDTLPAAKTACVVVKAKGKPFSEYNGMAAQELQ